MTKLTISSMFALAIAFVIGGHAAASPSSATTQPAHPFRDNVKVEVTDLLYVVHSDGLPDHSTGPFPNAHNPNTIRKQNYTFRIPRHPTWSDHITRTPMGPIGVAVNGVPFYNPYNAEGQDAAKLEVFDECCGHPDQMGRYHYHIYPKCMHTSFKDEAGKHSPLIGFAFDGYAIYGPNGEDGTPPKDLDECNGHTDPVRGYHYHVTNKFPYILGGYHGVVDPSNFDHGPPSGALGPMTRRGARPQPGYHLLPPFALLALELSADQRRQIRGLEGGVRAKLKEILSADQFRQLEEMRPPGGGPRPGGPGRGPGGSRDNGAAQSGTAPPPVREPGPGGPP